MEDQIVKNMVVLKSYQNGISIYLDDTVPFDDLMEEVAVKFRESSHFFKNAKMALSIEGRKVNEAEEMVILDTIEKNCDVQIVCLVSKDEEKNQQFVKAMKQLKDCADAENSGQFYRGTLKNHQVLETESSIVVLGDVYPGSTIISTRDIIVLGGLYGEAYAGGNGDKNHFIAALEMAPERLIIGDFKYKNKENKSRWGIKPKVQPKIAYVKDDRVIMEPITKELLDGIS